MAKIILDAGHGGSDPGAVYDGRLEKDDTLRLAMAVGDILEDHGVEVAYTRTEDVYDSPFEKAQIANREGGDFFVSIHRNSSPEPNQYSGVETLVYDKSGKKLELAEAINEKLEQTGFRILGVRERPGLVVLRRTKMPAVLVEVGFLNTEADNQRFDGQFYEIADAIAGGILSVLGMGQTGSSTGGTSGDSSGGASGGTSGGASGGVSGGTSGGASGGTSGGSSDGPDGGTSGGAEKFYRVQTGAFQRREYAEDLLYQLQRQNFPAYILREDQYYKVQVGAFRQLDNAVRMEAELRRKGYSTFITT